MKAECRFDEFAEEELWFVFETDYKYISSFYFLKTIIDDITHIKVKGLWY